MQNAVQLSCTFQHDRLRYNVTSDRGVEKARSAQKAIYCQQCSKCCDAAQCMWHYSGILSIMDYALGCKVGNDQVHHAARGHLHLKRITLTLFKINTHNRAA